MKILGLILVLYILGTSAEEKCRAVRKTMLSCMNAKEDDLPKTVQNNIEWLTISKSKIPNIKKNMLKNVPKITDFHATDVEIEIIEDDAFKILKSLNWIDVASNKIKKIDVNLIKGLSVDHFNISDNKDLEIPQRKPFLDSEKLKWLDLSSCEIKEFYSATFELLPSLRDLSIRNNKLKTLPEDIFAKNKNILSLDLTGNKIKHLSGQTFVHLRTMVARFEDNPWECDCHLATLLQWSKRNVMKGEVKCDKPKGKLWKDIVNPTPCDQKPLK